MDYIALATVFVIGLFFAYCIYSVVVYVFGEKSSPRYMYENRNGIETVIDAKDAE